MQDKELIRCPLIRCAHLMEQLCKPIFDKTPINFVSFARIYKDDGRSNLGVDANWQKYILANEFNLSGVEDALINHHRPTQSHELWSASSMFSLNQKAGDFFAACVAHNYGNGITLIEKGDDYTEFVHICIDQAYETPNEYLYKNIDYLWQIVLYLRAEIQSNPTLKKAYAKKYYYDITQAEKIKRYVDSAPQYPIFPIKKFYLSGCFGDTGFTKREIDCMIMLCQCLTMKEQSELLHLSIRTIEKHIEKIKKKIGVTSIKKLVYQLLSNNAFMSLVKSKYVHTDFLMKI